jgi:hypothetical protein
VFLDIPEIVSARTDREISKVGESAAAMSDSLHAVKVSKGICEIGHFSIRHIDLGWPSSVSTSSR